MRVAITGATGLVGANLAAHCVQAGYEVTCTRRANSATDHLRDYPIQWVQADLGDRAALEAAFSGAEIVVHCAAMVSFWPANDAAMKRANVDGTANVIAACKAAGVRRLVHCSSVDAIGLPAGDTPANEETPWNWDERGLGFGYPTTKYQSQCLVVAAAQQGELDAVVVNPTFMLGPLDPKPSSGQLLLAIAAGKMPGYTSGTNNFVDVRDVCRGIELAWQKGATGSCYILGNENLTYGEALTRIAKLIGGKPPRIAIPYVIGRLGGWFGDFVGWVTRREPELTSVTARMGYVYHAYSWEKAHKELGYTPGPLDQAVLDAWAWFQQEGKV